MVGRLDQSIFPLIESKFFSIHCSVVYKFDVFVMYEFVLNGIL